MLGVVEVRALESGELDRAAALVRSVWVEDPVFIARAEALADRRFRAAYVAVGVAGRLIGVSALYQTRHPHRFVTVDVGRT